MKKTNNFLENRSRYGGEQTWKLVRVVRFGSEGEVKEILKELISSTENPGNSRMRQQNCLMEILNTLMHLVWKYELKEQDLFSSNDNVYEQVLKMSSKEAEIFFVKLSIEINSQLTGIRRAESQTVKKAIAYTEKNYRNPELTVESVSGYMHLSQSYFSTVFKRGTGKRFVSFIRDLRLEKAAELLSATDEKMYIICREVGYEDPFYFSSIFKKKFGICPSEYRKNPQFLPPRKEGSSGID